eukprot:803949-Pelagomonas_calceolata.AAC.4
MLHIPGDSRAGLVIPPVLTKVTQFHVAVCSQQQVVGLDIPAGNTKQLQRSLLARAHPHPDPHPPTHSFHKAQLSIKGAHGTAEHGKAPQGGGNTVSGSAQRSKGAQGTAERITVAQSTAAHVTVVQGGDKVAQGTAGHITVAPYRASCGCPNGSGNS